MRRIEEGKEEEEGKVLSPPSKGLSPAGRMSLAKGGGGKGGFFFAKAMGGKKTNLLPKIDSGGRFSSLISRSAELLLKESKRSGVFTFIRRARSETS